MPDMPLVIVEWGLITLSAAAISAGGRGNKTLGWSLLAVSAVLGVIVLAT